MAKVSKDIRSVALPVLNWEPGNRNNSLQVLASHAIERADEATEWYLRAKKGKRIAARLLRFGAIVLTAAAGILPIIQQIFAHPPETPAMSPAWASVLVAIAVLLIAIDKFFGFSTAWLRYVTADLQIKQARETFEMDWQIALSSHDGQPPTEEQVRAALGLIKTFVDQINALVVAETAKWVAEFQEALRQAEEVSRATPTTMPTGSMAITVENGDQTTAPGWSLILDHGAPLKHTGKTAAMTNLATGDHIIRVEGTIGGKVVRAEAAVPVRAASIASVSLVLA